MQLFELPITQEGIILISRGFGDLCVWSFEEEIAALMMILSFQ